MEIALIDRYQNLFGELKVARKSSRHYHQIKNTEASQAAQKLIAAQRQISSFLRMLEPEDLSEIYRWRFHREPDYERETLIQKLSRI